MLLRVRATTDPAGVVGCGVVCSARDVDESLRTIVPRVCSTRRATRRFVVRSLRLRGVFTPGTVLYLIGDRRRSDDARWRLTDTRRWLSAV